VFARSGTLTIQDLSTCDHFDLNSTSGGTGAHNGASAGSDLFLMSGVNTQFDISANCTSNPSIRDDSAISLPPGQSYTSGTGAGPVLTKLGSGTLILTSASAFGGPTTMNAGVLEVDTQIGDVVLNGGVFQGVGVVGIITLNSGAVLRPAGSEGTLTGRSLMTWNGGGEVQVQLGSIAGQSASNLVVLNGALAKGTSGSFMIGIGQAYATPIIGHSYTLIDAASTNFTSGDFSVAPLAPLQTLNGNLSVSGGLVQFTVTGFTTDRLFADGYE
jgi:autotransporter-associated beta strand protein